MFGLFLESTPQDNFIFWGMMVLWISIFICTLIIELNTADLTTIWFCLSALVCFILSLFKVNYIVQIIVFCCCSISLLLIFFKYWLGLDVFVNIDRTSVIL